jgi:hypothetical protein
MVCGIERSPGFVIGTAEPQIAIGDIRCAHGGATLCATEPSAVAELGLASVVRINHLVAVVGCRGR